MLLLVPAVIAVVVNGFTLADAVFLFGLESRRAVGVGVEKLLVELLRKLLHLILDFFELFPGVVAQIPLRVLHQLNFILKFVCFRR